MDDAGNIKVYIDPKQDMLGSGKVKIFIATCPAITFIEVLIGFEKDIDLG